MRGEVYLPTFKSLLRKVKSMNILSNNVNVLYAVGIFLVGTGIGWFVRSYLTRKGLMEEERKARELITRSKDEIKNARKKVMLETREEWLKQKSQMEEKMRKKLTDVQRREIAVKEREQEAKIQLDYVEQEKQRFKEKDEEFKQLKDVLQGKETKLNKMMEEQNQKLEKISGFSREEAKRQLSANFKKEAKYEAARSIKEIRDEALRTGEMEAQKILALAIERMASDFSATRTTSQVVLADEKLKGRIIGHEGRNIRAFEKTTGIQVIVDESPDTVILSGFNPIKREVARIAIEMLIDSGSINPRKIEEVVGKAERKMIQEIRAKGEEVVKKMGVAKVHPEMVELVGRLRYRTSYGQNVLDHSLEVSELTAAMAVELGLDEKLAKRAGLLHDIGKAIDYEAEGTHPEIGVEVAKKYGENDVVINAIASHHEDVEVTHPISVLVSAADAISGARPGSRRKSLVDYMKRVDKLESLANSFEGVEQSYAIQAGREVRVIAKHDIVDDAKVELLASELASRIKSEMDYPGRVKVTVIRQMKAQEVAR
jgi:ribonuclease Y